MSFQYGFEGKKQGRLDRRVGEMVNGNFIMGRSLNKQRVAVRNIGKAQGKHVDRRVVTGFRATPDGDGWFTSNGKRVELVSPKRGVCNPFVMVRDPAYHHCQPVPDQDYSGVYLSDGVYFWLQMFQLEKHLSWILRTKFRINPEARSQMVKSGVDQFIDQIKRERGINLKSTLSNMYTETDELLIDNDERVRDFVRRYGRDTRKLRN